MTMEDFDYVCPLCCEELDISDREFYPCKCGYQVCMWCWHRIRESETGLCPACRTPYGEDPHQFSAIDVEEVLKANKEREAAAKRERTKQLHEDGRTNSPTNAGNSVNSHNNVEVVVPKDRTQLANMRVIRRNLVYAVGLPASIANEEILKKPEYFGQYGKIAKIVLNRAQVVAGRNSSASAYVTFAHKEDTLACILALDGFYLDGRNIRASYGTSKYCSAFIKNVRCNNPECTYLHEMGAPEDTFTKQEIQAGYVTSGRDVLARQQQILMEQLRETTEQASSSSGRNKKVGCGGPSGTGKAATNPVFPPPEFEEANKAPSMVPPLPAPRAVTTGSAIPAQPLKNRSASTGAKSPSLAERKTTTVASVVAGLHNNTKPDDTPNATTTTTTLTPLTPLKRTTKTKGDALRNGKKTLNSAASSVSSIGGDVIGPHNTGIPGGLTATESLESLGGEEIPFDSVIGRSNSLGGSSSGLGGEIYTGHLPGKKMPIGNDKWNSSGPIGGTPLTGGSLSGNNGGSNLASLWGDDHAPGPSGGVIGSPVGGSNHSTSALASLLGINLPSGSGSLQESPSLWSSTPGPSALSSLNGTSVPTTNSGDSVGGSSLIGGVPIGGNKSDIALLQSLLPGVHITSGNESFGNWSAAPGAQRSFSHDNNWGDTSSIGPGKMQRQQQGPGIW